MPRHSTPCHLTSSSTTVRRQSSSFPVLRLLPASSSIHISPLPRHRSSTPRPSSTMPHLPPPPPSRSSLTKQPRKPSRNKTSNKPPSISRSSLTSRPQSPALLQEQASQSDANRPPAKKPRATHRFKPRPRAHSLSLACSPARPSEIPDAKPTLPAPRRPRTVTLNEQFTRLKSNAVSSRPKSSRRGSPLDLLERATSKSDARPKRTLKKRSGRTRAERRRVSTSSSDEAELSLGVEALDEPSPTTEIMPRSSMSPRILKPISTSPTTPSLAPITSSAEALPNTAVQCLHGSAQPKLPSSARPVVLRAGVEGKPNLHQRTKSAASILDSSTPVTLIPINLRINAVQDDWDMPPNAFGPGLGLTWQQKKKSKPKSTSAIDSTLSVATLSTPSNLSKKTVQSDSPVTGISPLLRSTSLRTKTTRRGRAPLARTPSAGNVIQIVSSSLGNRPKSPMVPSDSEPFDGSQSLPPSPTLARCSFASSSRATESQKFKIEPLSIVGSDTSLTWQQAIMRSSPPKNTFQGSSNHVDKTFNDPSKLGSAKRIVVPSSLNPAFTTPVKSASSLPRSAPLISTSTKKLLHRSSTPLPLIGTLDAPEPKESSTSSPQTYLCNNLIMPPRPSTNSSKSSPITGLTNKYAGPQFHNSPAPTTLPAPKFSFGS